MSLHLLPLPKTYRLIHIMRPSIVYHYICWFTHLSIMLFLAVQYTIIPTITDILHPFLPDAVLLAIFIVLIARIPAWVIHTLTIYVGIHYLIRAKQARLVLSLQGISLYGVRSQRFTPWHNIASIAYVRRGRYLEKQLRLRQPALLRVKLAEGVRQNMAVLDTPWWYAWRQKRQTGFMPISLSKQDWVNSELDAYLQQYAPQAFSSFAPIPNALDLDK